MNHDNTPRGVRYHLAISKETPLSSSTHFVEAVLTINEVNHYPIRFFTADWLKDFVERQPAFASNSNDIFVNDTKLETLKKALVYLIDDYTVALSFRKYDEE